MSRLIALVVFLGMLAGVNVLSLFYSDPAFVAVVEFFNENLVLMLIITVIFFLSELFGILRFPFNLPYPLFSAVGSLFVMSFLYNMFYFVDKLASAGIFSFIGELIFLIYPLIFLIVLIVGYIKIFSKLGNKKKTVYIRRARADWDEVGDEFKGLVKDALKEARKSIKDKEKKSSGSKKKTSKKTKKQTTKKKR